MPVFLDTNIFLYAAGKAHPFRGACARVLRRVAEGTFEATINTEVVQEILYVLIRRGRREDALSLAAKTAALFPDMLSVTRDDMALAFDLLRRYPRLAPRDAVHAATMLRNGIRTVISVDPHFDVIPDIQRTEP